jgi:hypothetical protein
MKYSKIFLPAAIVVMALGLMAPGASADSQKLVIGSNDITVQSYKVTGSNVDITVPLTLFDLGLLFDQITNSKIPTMSLEFFAPGSSTPFVTETFSDVYVSATDIFKGKMGRRELEGDFRFKTSDIVYSTSVPEPSSLGLLAAGLIGLFAVSRKKFSFSQRSAQ